MDAWNETYIEPSEDDLTVRRVVSLALVLSNAGRPLLTSELRDEVYYDLETPVFRKTFQRDRERLADAGFVLKNGPKIDRESTWTIDAQASFAQFDDLSQEEALTLDFLLLPLASDPGYPYAHDLQIALTKIDRSFDESSRICLSPSARIRNNTLTRVERALVSQTVISMHYRRYNGSMVTRSLAPFGLFELNGNTYLVAATVQGNTVLYDNPHTYNLARMSAIKEVAKPQYEVPADFDVRDYIMLPFQMGPAQYEATFVAAGNANEQRAQYAYQGRWEATDAGALFHTKVFDEQLAASWAIAENMKPLAPASLANAWRTQLARMASL